MQHRERAQIAYYVARRIEAQRREKRDDLIVMAICLGLATITLLAGF
jgi:hypothetical protein